MKYYTYQEEDIQKAKFLVKRGSSLRKAAEETGVPFNTIRDHLRYEQENKTDIVRGKNRELTDSEESDLANYATYMSERGFPITRKVLKKLVVDIIIPRRSRRDIVLASSVRPSVHPHFLSVRNHISVPIGQI